MGGINASRRNLSSRMQRIINAKQLFYSMRPHDCRNARLVVEKLRRVCDAEQKATLPRSPKSLHVVCVAMRQHVHAATSAKAMKRIDEHRRAWGIWMLHMGTRDASKSQTKVPILLPDPSCPSSPSHVLTPPLAPHTSQEQFLYTLLACSLPCLLVCVLACLDAYVLVCLLACLPACLFNCLLV